MAVANLAELDRGKQLHFVLVSNPDKRLDGIIIDGRKSIELKAEDGKEKPIICGCLPQSYGLNEVREKT